MHGHSADLIERELRRYLCKDGFDEKRTLDDVRKVLYWINEKQPRIPAEVNPRNLEGISTDFHYKKRYVCTDDTGIVVNRRVDLRRIIRQGKPAIALPQDLYIRLANLKTNHFFSSSWLENIARNDPLVTDAIASTLTGFGVLAKQTDTKLSVYGDSEIISPLLIIPGVDMETYGLLRQWEKRFSVDRNLKYGFFGIASPEKPGKYAA
ncbi:hypothetical protein GF345_04990 [Candidatus Woesearchaeota archaeon]|nr:hypothetical protein [Candidatus Woesearchaeota archaeon]